MSVPDCIVCQRFDIFATRPVRAAPQLRSAMRIQEPRLALTFDDVLIVPGLSEVHPNQVDLKTRVCRDIKLNIPILSAAMDTVTESRLAIALAQEGGIGVVHKNLSIEAQADEVDKVKRSEAGMIVDPVTMRPEQRIREALEVMAQLQDLRRAGDRPRRPPGRHPDQSRPALRERTSTARSAT